tara:strand:- start:970 stop:1941 length:972 start_codon:yes stop_codon:yes gene_type:complete
MNINKVLLFFKLIRYKNLLIIGLTQIIIKFYLINKLLQKSYISDSTFALFVLATLLIAAAGYIINDIYDIEIDKINKPKKCIINNGINVLVAKKLYIILNIIGFVLGILVSINSAKHYFVLIFIYCIFSLWHYSKYIKRSFLIGNLQISFLIFLSILNVILLETKSITLQTNHSFNAIFTIIIYYAFFAFLLNLIREIIKDIEDQIGDKTISSNTLIIKLGLEKTKIFILILIGIVFFGLTYFQYFQYSFLNTVFEHKIILWGVSNFSIYYIVFLQLLLLLKTYKVLMSKTKEDFSKISSYSKIIMLLGIFSIPIFTYIFLNL